MDPLSQKDVESFFQIANIKVLKIWRLPNQYYTFSEDETDEDIQRNAVYRERRPWWLVKTPHGMIEIGPRKRVIEIRWSDTNIEKIVTTDDVTKGVHLVHAYSNIDAIKYLVELAKAMV
jgi:hypothetical protein